MVWQLRILSLALFTLSAVGCVTLPAGNYSELGLPAQLAGSAVVLKAADSDYSRAVLSEAVKPVGNGGISAGLVVKLTKDVTIYRLWSGPEKKDEKGNTNRLGSWWSYDSPTGKADTYRVNYEICKNWNDLTWVATCTLKSGSVVAIGPGQSVTALTCKDKTGGENYPANPVDWQLYIDKAWTRSSELVCPDVAADYKADPYEISKRMGN